MNYKKLIQPIIILFLLVVIFTQRSCNSQKEIYKEKIVKHFDTIYKPSEIKTVYKTKYTTLNNDVVYLPGRIDTVEIKTFEKVEDTTKIKMFANTTKIRKYNNVFNDSIADVSIYTETKGELLKIVPTITVKARIPEKKTIFALYAGGGLYLNNNFELGYKYDLRFQNKKGDLIGTSYDPVNKNFFIDYNFRVFNIKK